MSTRLIKSILIKYFNGTYNYEMTTCKNLLEKAENSTLSDYVSIRTSRITDMPHCKGTNTKDVVTDVTSALRQKEHAIKFYRKMTTHYANVIKVIEESFALLDVEEMEVVEMACHQMFGEIKIADSIKKSVRTVGYRMSSACSKLYEKFSEELPQFVKEEEKITSI